MLHYWKSGHGNFGDDLNEWIWSDFIHEDLLAAANRDVVIIGVGTILDRSIPTHGLRCVMGSGGGYAPLPDLDTGSSQAGEWRLEFLRGPLTQRLVEDRGPAITDGGILVAHYFPQTPVADRKQPVLVPHFKSMMGSAWNQVCSNVGVEYLDPTGDSRTVVRRIGEASLVFAESMHAAIVADALRVPWIPVATSPEISSFKWNDFTLSLGLDYCPVLLPASTGYEALRNKILRHTDRNLLEGFADGQPGSTLAASSIEEELQGFAAIMELQNNRLAKKADLAERTIRRLIRDFVPVSAISSRKRIETCKAALNRAMAGPSMLSSLDAHRGQLNRVKDILKRYATPSGLT